MLKMKHGALLFTAKQLPSRPECCDHFAKLMQPAVYTPPKAPAYQMVQRAVIQIAVYDAVVAMEGGFNPSRRAVRSPLLACSAFLRLRLQHLL